MTPPLPAPFPERPAAAATADVDVSEPISLKLVTRKATHELERQIILKVLKANNWNRQKTARFLKISYRSLLYKLNEVGATGAEDLHKAHSKLKVEQPTATQSLSSNLESTRLVH